MTLNLNYNTSIIYEQSNRAVEKAIENLKRDFSKTCIMTEKKGNDIVLIHKVMQPEQFEIYTSDEKLVICAYDPLGFVYGLYHVSKDILGIQPFWFWNDQKIEQRPYYEIEESYRYVSKPCAVKYRGWFINDEVLIHTWYVDRQKDKPWEMAFEALLRCRGNLVIPGTDKNSERYRGMAASMGLYITHHHAEPLGAPMFARVYPNLNPSYEEYPEKFQELWKEGIREQKSMNVVWNLGFRGQGDCPFWDNDPRYQTPESRGELMGQLIKLQYDLVKQNDPDAVCCTNLYGETMELYKGGYLKLPENIIKIWADNGFGKMVTRRQGNHNPRIYALPDKTDHGSHGIYYHVSFYDLQAANHITMLPNSAEFVHRELKEVLDHQVKDYWIVNCSNIKPHVYFLDLIANMWQKGDINVQEHRDNYIRTYYGKQHVEQIGQCFQEYANKALPYGKHEDEHAGEQFANHVARMLISQYLKDKGKRSEDLLWATDAATLQEQVLWYKQLCESGVKRYDDLCRIYEQTDAQLEEKERVLFEDSLYLQAKIYFHCYQGGAYLCDALLHAFQEDYQFAFYMAGKARKSYLQANDQMRAREHGKWHGFYENECLTDVKQTAWVLEGLMSYIRNLGDGPHFYLWQREFLYSEEDRRVVLICNMENHLKDLELFELMEERYGNI